MKAIQTKVFILFNEYNDNGNFNSEIEGIFSSKKAVKKYLADYKKLRKEMGEGFYADEYRTEERIIITAE